jgi:hypothetical protein
MAPLWRARPRRVLTCPPGAPIPAFPDPENRTPGPKLRRGNPIQYGSWCSPARRLGRVEHIGGGGDDDDLTATCPFGPSMHNRRLIGGSPQELRPPSPGRSGHRRRGWSKGVALSGRCAGNTWYMRFQLRWDGNLAARRARRGQPQAGDYMSAVDHTTFQTIRHVRARVPLLEIHETRGMATLRSDPAIPRIVTRLSARFPGCASVGLDLRASRHLRRRRSHPATVAPSSSASGGWCAARDCGFQQPGGRHWPSGRGDATWSTADDPPHDIRCDTAQHLRPSTGTAAA